MCRLKLPVHAAADDVVDHPDVGIETGSRQEGVRTEIHEQVFDFYRHALAQHFLDAGADGEAYARCRLGKGGRGGDGKTRLNCSAAAGNCGGGGRSVRKLRTSKSNAARAVKQPGLVGYPPEPPAYRGKPIQVPGIRRHASDGQRAWAV